MTAETETLLVHVVTPEGALHKGEAAFVAVPAADGELGVLPHHTPLIAQLGIGELRVQAADGGEGALFAVRGGFLQVVADKVTLLATEALPPAEIDVEALEEERKEILKKLLHPASDEEYQELLADRRWLETREKVAKHTA